MVDRDTWLGWLESDETSDQYTILGRTVDTYDIEELQAALGFLYRLLLRDLAEDLLEDEDIARVDPKQGQ